MKPIHKPVILLSVLLIFFACKDSVNGVDDNKKIAYRLSAYNSLTESDKSTITSDWQNAPVNSGVYTSNEYGGPAILLEGYSLPVGYLTPLSRTFEEGTPLVTVTFNTNNEALLGPIVVILLAEDATVIGSFGRY